MTGEAILQRERPVDRVFLWTRVPDGPVEQRFLHLASMRIM
jgi:hypothetical protein